MYEFLRCISQHLSQELHSTAPEFGGQGQATSKPCPSCPHRHLPSGANQPRPLLRSAQQISVDAGTLVMQSCGLSISLRTLGFCNALHAQHLETVHDESSYHPTRHTAHAEGFVRPCPLPVQHPIPAAGRYTPDNNDHSMHHATPKIHSPGTHCSHSQRERSGKARVDCASQKKGNEKERG